MSKTIKLTTGKPITFDSANGLPQFVMTGYSGVIVDSAYGDMIVDLAGMKLRSDVTPIFQHHDSTRIVGHAKAAIDSTVQLEGVVSGTGEAAKEVLETSANGFPWQASIGFNIAEMEELEEGEEREVNGLMVSGPAIILTDTELYETSFVPLGRDKNTHSTIFSRDAEEAFAALAAKPTKTEHETMSENTTPEAKYTAEELEAAKADVAKETAQQLKALTAEFGQDVALDALERGLSSEQVKVEQYDAIKAELSALKTRSEALEAELEAANSQEFKAEGEEVPADHIEELSTEENPSEAFESLVAEKVKSGMGQGEAFRAAMSEKPELAAKAANL